MKKYHFTFFFLLVICATSQAQTDKDKQAYINEFANILTSPFFDKGSWLGITLPEEGLGLGVPLVWNKNQYQPGQPLFSCSYNIADSIHRFPVEISNRYLPGKLVQQAQHKHFSVTASSIFTSSHTVLVAYTVANRSALPIACNLKWLFFPGDSIANMQVYRSLPNARMEIRFEQPLSSNSKNDVVIKVQVPAYQSATTYITLTYWMNDEAKPLQTKFADAAKAFRENTNRWYSYLAPYKKASPQKKLLAAKCIQTLIANWKSPSGNIKHSGLFPSVGTFPGFWAWDAWKHAVALASFEPALAKDQIRALFDYQNDEGMVPDVVFREGFNWRDTKPPLAAWAVYEVFQTTHDTLFVKEMFDRLFKYHQWWYKYRSHNQNGLCEFGSTDGTIKAAKWESGMDNAVRFDSAVMLQNSQGAWSLSQQSVDLNAYLYAEKKYLAALAKLLHQRQMMQQLEKALPLLKVAIQTVFYDEASGYFYDYDFVRKVLVKAIGTEAWTTLWAGVASAGQASKVLEEIMDKAHFNTYLPFPTISLSNPKYDPHNGYWRGLVWIDQAWFALQGMKKYGYVKQAAQMQQKLLEHAEGLFEKQITIRENYSPENGAGLNAKGFSWSAAFFLLMLKDMQ